MIVGILDSGLGGIAVLNELIKLNKLTHYIYYGDYKNLPYGNKNDMQLKSYLKAAKSFFLSKKCDFVIVACNTLSTIIENDNYFITPIQYIKNIININKKSKILVLATKKTIKSEVYKSNNTICISCPKFVKIIENSNTDLYDKVINQYLRKYEKIDMIILGCTHYNFIKEYIYKYYNNKIKIIDSCVVLADNIKIENEKLIIELYVTKLTDKIKKNITTKLIKKP